MEQRSETMSEERMRVTRFCFVSGMCAAAGSVVGKLATDPSPILLHVLTPAASQRESGCQDQRCNDQQDSPSHLTHSVSPDLESIIFVSVQTALFLLMILINSFMWTLYSKALSVSRSGTEATVMNMGFNFLFTSLFSGLVFGERVTSRSILGSCLMLTGLLVLQSDHQHDQKHEQKSGLEQQNGTKDEGKGGRSGKKEV